MKTNLRRILVVVALIVATVTAANAQFRFGVKAGININKLSLENMGDNFKADNGCGFTGGVMTEFQIPVIGLCLDASLMYTRMNSIIDQAVAADGTEMVKTSGKNFFQIPINVKWKIGLPVVGKFLSPYIFTGPDFAFKLGGSDDVFKTKTFQCAWNIGLGVELLRHVQVGASYGFGMNTVLKQVTPINNTSKDIKGKNNYWTVTAAYLF